MTTGESDKKIPVIGKASKRPQSPGCISREQGFDQASQTDDGSPARPDTRASESRLEKEEKKRKSQSPERKKDVRFVDRATRKYMTAVKNDLTFFKTVGKNREVLS